MNGWKKKRFCVCFISNTSCIFSINTCSETCFLVSFLTYSVTVGTCFTGVSSTWSLSASVGATDACCFRWSSASTACSLNSICFRASAGPGCFMMPFSWWAWVKQQTEGNAVILDLSEDHLDVMVHVSEEPLFDGSRDGNSAESSICKNGWVGAAEWWDKGVTIRRHVMKATHNRN